LRVHRIVGQVLDVRRDANDVLELGARPLQCELQIGETLTDFRFEAAGSDFAGVVAPDLAGNEYHRAGPQGDYDSGRESPIAFIQYSPNRQHLTHAAAVVKNRRTIGRKDSNGSTGNPGSNEFWS